MNSIVYCATHEQFHPCPRCEAQRMAEDRDAAMSQRVDLSGDYGGRYYSAIAIAACVAIGLVIWLVTGGLG